MDSTGNSFTGSYTYTLDAKGRINIPAKMRKALDPASDATFVATRGNDACITLYPATVWKQVEVKLLALDIGKPAIRHYIRNIVRHAEALQYDGQGRVPLPAGLIEYASITKSAEIVGMIDRIEIWNPQSLKALETRLTDDSEALENIANEIDI